MDFFDALQAWYENGGFLVTLLNIAIIVLLALV